MPLHQATCMIRDGAVGGGLVYADTVLDTLTVEHHTDLVARSPAPPPPLFPIPTGDGGKAASWPGASRYPPYPRHDPGRGTGT